MKPVYTLMNGETPPKTGASVIELVIKIITPVITLIGIWIGVWQFTTQQQNTNTQEFLRRIWEKRLAAYMDINAAAANVIINAGNHDSLIKANNAFEKTFWQNLPVIDDSTVEERLVFFRDQVSDRINGNADLNNRNILEIAARNAAIACQYSINNSWKEVKK